MLLECIIIWLFLQDKIEEIHIAVDPKHHRHFVVRRGEVLRQIADDYGGVSVSFPRSGQKSDQVTLKGAKDCVEGAKKRILEIVQDLVSLTFKYQNCHVISVAFFFFSNFSITPCLFACYGQHCYRDISFQESQITMDCIIAQKYHRTVMGPKGFKVQEITREFDVGIKFPDRPTDAECK